MPRHLDAQGELSGDAARDGCRLLGMRDPVLIATIWDLDNRDPKNLKIDFLPGSHLPVCLSAAWELALMSGHAVSCSFNGVAATMKPKGV